MQYFLKADTCKLKVSDFNNVYLFHKVLLFVSSPGRVAGVHKYIGVYCTYILEQHVWVLLLYVLTVY